MHAGLLPRLHVESHLARIGESRGFNRDRIGSRLLRQPHQRPTRSRTISERYVIIRSPVNAEDGAEATGERYRSSRQPNPPASIDLSIEELSLKEVAELVKDPSTTAAPSMPIKLIAPRARTTIPEQAVLEPEDLWGLSAVGANTSPFTGAGVIVGILDTGIEGTHPAFAGMHLRERDFTSEGSGDRNGHGTHCAGTIFGRPVHGTRIGVAPGVEQAVVAKVLDAAGSGTLEGIIRGIDWCIEQGASIISMSLGIDFASRVDHHCAAGYPIDVATSEALRDYYRTVTLFERYAALLEAQTMINKGAIVVAATGNESRADDCPPYRLWASPPASAPGVIAVAAIGRPASRALVHPLAPFSNWGADLVAPGVDIVSAALGGGLCEMDGTSMAVPHVAGIAALWAQKQQLMSGSARADIVKLRLLGAADIARLPLDVHDELGSGLAMAPGR
jgi:subtilisin family serine protease